MTTVIKVGGARAVDPAGALADVASLYEDGEDVVLVHGGSTAVDETLERLGIEPEYVETPSGVVGRFTDEETMEVFEMVFGHLNTQLVAGLQGLDVDAVGLNGVDGKLLHGPRKSAVRVVEDGKKKIRRGDRSGTIKEVNGVDGKLLHGPRKSAVRVVEDGKKKIRRGDHSGTIKEVNVDLLESLLEGSYVPVASPPMAGADDGMVTPVNTDADRSAAAIAGALDATLVLLTDVEGVYRDPDDSETLIEDVETAEEWNDLEAAAEGFMGRKIMAAGEALDAGSPEVVVADANADDPILSALGGSGTHVHASAVAGDQEAES